MSEQEMWLALPTAEKEEKADLLLGLARQAEFRGAGGESLELANSALAVYQEMKAVAPQSEIANCHLSLAVAYKLLLQGDEAMKEIDIAIELQREAGYPFLDDLLRTRATWCSEMGDWEGTLAGHLEAVRQHEVEGNEEWEAKSWVNVGYAYNQMKKYPEAIDAFNGARDKFKARKMVPEVANCDRWLSDTYSELGDGQRAFEYAKKSMNVAELMQERLPTMFSEYVLGKALVVLNELTDAERHLSNSYSHAIQCDQSDMDWGFIVKVQKERANLYRLQNRFNEADEIEIRIHTVQEVIE